MPDNLARIELLNGLPEAELVALAKRCRWRRFDADQQVLAHLDPGTDVLFLVEGRLRVSIYSPSGKEVSFEDLEAGQTFGELAAIDDKGRSSSRSSTGPFLFSGFRP